MTVREFKEAFEELNLDDRSLLQMTIEADDRPEDLIDVQTMPLPNGDFHGICVLSKV